MAMSAASNPLMGAPLSEQLVSRYDALVRLAEAIRSHPDEKDLFRTCANELQQVIPFHGLLRFDPAANWVRLHSEEQLDAWRDELALLLRAIPKEESIARWVHQNQQPVVIRFDGRETRFRLVIDHLGKIGLRSLCALPLTTAHRQLGSLLFTSRQEDAYTAEDQRFLSLVANQIAVAMDDALAQRRLKLLLDVTNRVVTKLELRDLLQEISASIREMMHCDAVGVALPDQETSELRLYAEGLPGPEEIMELRRRKPWNPPTWEAELADDVFRTGQLVNFTKEQFASEPRVRGAAGHNSFCLLPLVSHKRVQGVLGVCSTQENAYSQDDVSFLGQVASQIALAVDNALAYGQISQLKEKFARENVY